MFIYLSLMKIKVPSLRVHLEIFIEQDPKVSPGYLKCFSIMTSCSVK